MTVAHLGRLSVTPSKLAGRGSRQLPKRRGELALIAEAKALGNLEHRFIRVGEARFRPLHPGRQDELVGGETGCPLECPGKMEAAQTREGGEVGEGHISMQVLLDEFKNQLRLSGAQAAAVRR